MKKVINYVKGHFVETVGFIVIIFLIIFISYLKFYKKTFTCELTTKDGNVKVYQNYKIKQKNNHIKSISYYYKVTSPSKTEIEQISNFYKNLINENEDMLYESNINLVYKKNKLVLSYDISDKEIKNNKIYKSTRTLIGNLKASKFTCK